MGKQRELSPTEEALLETNLRLTRALLKVKETLEESVEIIAKTKELAEEQLREDEAFKKGSEEQRKASLARKPKKNESC